MQGWHSATITHRLDVGSELVRLSLRVTPEVASAFHTAGQYHRLRAPRVGVEVTLAIASAPGSEVFDYLVKRHGPGATLVTEAQVGEVVLVSTPEGPGFPVEQARGKRLVLVATGTGIAPIRSVLQVVQRRRGEFGAVTALYGVRTREHLAYEEELATLAADRLEVWPTLSQPDPSWTGRVGRVHAHFDHLAVDEALVFLCGQREMVTEARARLAERGVPAERLWLNLPR